MPVAGMIMIVVLMGVIMMAAHIARRIAPGRILVPRLGKAPRPRQVFGRHAPLRSVPRRSPAAPEAMSRGKCSRISRLIVRNSQHGAPLAMPGLDHGEKIAHRLGIHGIEWLVEQDQIRVLQQAPAQTAPAATGRQTACPGPGPQTLPARRPRARACTSALSAWRKPADQPAPVPKPSATRSNTRAGKCRSTSDCCGR